MLTSHFRSKRSGRFSIWQTIASSTSLAIISYGCWTKSGKRTSLSAVRPPWVRIFCLVSPGLRSLSTAAKGRQQMLDGAVKTLMTAAEVDQTDYEVGTLLLWKGSHAPGLVTVGRCLHASGEVRQC
jgi:hypothetical protein